MDTHDDSRPDARRLAIHAALRTYVDLHPGACDTLQGIRAWWLKDKDADEPMIEQVLEEMVREGTIQNIRLAGDVVVYRVAAAAAGEG